MGAQLVPSNLYLWMLNLYRLWPARRRRDGRHSIKKLKDTLGSPYALHKVIEDRGEYAERRRDPSCVQHKAHQLPDRHDPRDDKRPSVVQDGDERNVPCQRAKSQCRDRCVIGKLQRAQNNRRTRANRRKMNQKPTLAVENRPQTNRKSRANTLNPKP
jgi:hypothetical protein